MYVEGARREIITPRHNRHNGKKEITIIMLTAREVHSRSTTVYSGLLEQQRYYNKTKKNFASQEHNQANYATTTTTTKVVNLSHAVILHSKKF